MAAILSRLTEPVLVVEDQSFFAQVFVRMLERMGLTAETVPTAERAMNKLSNRLYSTLLTDCDLPGMSGPDLAKAIRQMENGKSVLPIVGISANGSAERRKECIDAGMDAFVPKPIHEAELAAAIQKATGRPLRQRLVATQPSEECGRNYTLELLRFVAAAGPDNLSGVLAGYVRALHESLKTLADAVDSRDCAQIRNRAHALVSHFIMVRNFALINLTKRLEIDAAEGKLEMAVEYLQAIRQESDFMVKALETQAFAIVSPAA